MLVFSFLKIRGVRESLPEFKRCFIDAFLSTEGGISNLIRLGFIWRFSMHSFLLKTPHYTIMTDSVVLKAIQNQLEAMDTKLNALLVKEEPPTKEELRAMKRGHKEIAEGKLVSWETVKARNK